MESISVFDIFKIGVGPSSSHTMGPWRAAQRFLEKVEAVIGLSKVESVRVDLFGSLAKTGKGHGTDHAVLWGLLGEDPETCDVETLFDKIEAIKQSGRICLNGKHDVPFDVSTQLVFHFDKALPFHPNGLSFTASSGASGSIEETYYSVGGGFVVQEGQPLDAKNAVRLPFPIEKGDELLRYCQEQCCDIPSIVMQNERTWRTDEEIHARLDLIWSSMLGCIYRGSHTAGVLPGGLSVVRRAAPLSTSLLGEEQDSPSLERWLVGIRKSGRSFQTILRWVSCFALAVNEENASFGRVVTAPTNGAAGVIPAVMLYYRLFCKGTDKGLRDFMLVSGELGSLFKKGATISAAMGGCQAEIGVSSAMAAGGLAHCLGASPERVLMAAEIAMEHHLGMTCDPIGGLVQIPCIERNTMGAMKAITAANIALESDPAQAKVSLDQVIRSMWETALDMNHKYKETSEGGLAVNIPVNIPEC